LTYQLGDWIFFCSLGVLLKVAGCSFKNPDEKHAESKENLFLCK
jgi:hypothetical protein